jgi:acyl-coenzyme A thioesterase PaaI-like protein
MSVSPQPDGSQIRLVAEVPIATKLVADRVRDVIDACIHTDSPAADLEAAAQLIEEATQLLRKRSRATSLQVTRSNGGISINNAVEGPCNPIAPPLTDLVYVDGETSGCVTFPTAAEGPPGRAHGGLVAAVLDHALGRAVAWKIAAAMTVSITVDYRAATPLHRPLDVTARVVSVDGRKVFAEAEIRHDGQITAVAKATMIVVAGLPSIAPTAVSLD